MKKILVINGPNLDLLGKRETDIYGDETIDSINAEITSAVEDDGNEAEFFQSNHEGEIIDTIQDERQWCDGIIINPGAFAHYSYAIRDAIASISKPAVEVHLSDINKRESFRKKSVISDVCLTLITGKGKAGYLEALEYLKNL